MGFAVMAIQALTLFSAFLSGSKAVTVIFSTGRFFTSTPSQRYESRNILESTGMPEVCHLLSLVYLHLKTHLVGAAIAETFLIAESTLRETLTVHFEAIYFGAFTALMGKLARRKVQGRYGAKNVIPLSEGLFLVDQHIE